MVADWKAGDRVMVRPEHDPLFAFGVRHGLPRAVGTVTQVDWEHDDRTVYVTWDDSERGEAQGAMSPHPVDELERARASSRTDP